MLVMGLRVDWMISVMPSRLSVCAHLRTCERIVAVPFVLIGNRFVLALGRAALV
jgi:hypothetical protein